MGEMAGTQPSPVKQLPAGVDVGEAALSKAYLLPHYLLSGAITEGNGARARKAQRILRSSTKQPACFLLIKRSISPPGFLQWSLGPPTAQT